MAETVITHRTDNPYKNPEIARWLGSLEAGGTWPQTRETPAEQLGRAPWQNALHRGLDWLGVAAPGIVLAAALAWVGVVGAELLGESVLGFQSSPISAILVTVLLGLIVRNVAGLPAVYERGMKICVKRLLRIGIALLGLRLSLSVVGQVGLIALPIIIVCIAGALLVVTWLTRALGLPPRLGALIAVGTSICGVSAVVATSPVIDADEEEASYAVACVTLFGMAALFVYPFLSHWMFAGDPTQAGLFLGTAIHDTAQAAGAGLMYEQRYGAPEALNVAATTKLMRNVCMGAVIPLIAILYHRDRGNGTRGEKGAAGRLKLHQYVPLFVVGFVALAAVRSLGDIGERAFGVIDRDLWHALLAAAETASFVCLGVAMAAVGLGTSLTRLRRLGWKPMCVGLGAALLVGGLSAGMIRIAAAFL